MLSVLKERTRTNKLTDGINLSLSSFGGSKRTGLWTCARKPSIFNATPGSNVKEICLLMLRVPSLPGVKLSQSPSYANLGVNRN